MESGRPCAALCAALPVCGDALLIFCGSRQRLGALAPEEFEAAEEFWETPLVWDYIKVRLRRMMEQIKLGYDYYITQTYLDTAIDSIPDMLWFKTLDGIHVKVNKAFCSVVGKTREDVTGQNHCYIWGYPRMIMKMGRHHAGNRRMRL